MITAQDIREKTFEKSKFGGYEMSVVDEFLETIADDLTAAQKESAVLKSKMKVLVDKIEEYRANESSLNQALLSAQKLAAQIEAEAKERAEKMIADAEAQVKEKLGTIQEKTELEEKKLAAAKAASAKFFDGINAMCNAQLKNMQSISESYLGKADIEPEIPAVPEFKATAPKAEPVPEFHAPAANKALENDVDEAIRSIEASVSKAKPSRQAQFDFSEEMNAAFGIKKDKDSTQPFML